MVDPYIISCSPLELISEVARKILSKDSSGDDGRHKKEGEDAKVGEQFGAGFEQKHLEVVLTHVSNVLISDLCTDTNRTSRLTVLSKH